MRTWPSVDAFYAASATRARSAEVDVGLWWREGRSGPTYRAAWIRATGELYTVRHGPRACGGGVVEILTRIASERQLVQAFAGWREVCGSPGSAAWLRRRAGGCRSDRRALAQALG